MLNLILGFIRIEIVGLNLEKFIEKLIKQEVGIKNLVRPDYNRILLDVPLTHRRKLFDIAREMCYNITVQKVSGLCGLGVFLKRKIGIALGLVSIIILLIVSNMFVFSVRVYGTQSITAGQVTEFLRTQNIGQFSRKAEIDSSGIERILITKFDLSMCSVVVWGGSLIVNIKEKLEGT